MARPDGRIDPGIPVSMARRVIVITVDGLGGRYLEERLATGGLPALRRLAEWGASTRNARADPVYTVTLPGHASILTGRPVSDIPGFPPTIAHGYVWDDMPMPEETLHNAGNPRLGYVASLFDVAHDHGLRTCFYAGKPKFILYWQSYDAGHGAPDRVGEDDGSGKIDRCVIAAGATEQLLGLAADDRARDSCDVVFFHFADLDQEGHLSGWGRASWLERLDQVDEWVGSLTELARPGGDPEPWAVVLTADHGGSGFAHGDPTLIDDYRIPLYVVGPDVPGGVDLYQWGGNARADPGAEHPSYAGLPEPYWNGDTANIALELLGLPPVPGAFLTGLGDG